MKVCLVCGKHDSKKPMAFRGENWCSENHRKELATTTVPITVSNTVERQFVNVVAGRY